MMCQLQNFRRKKMAVNLDKLMFHPMLDVAAQENRLTPCANLQDY